LLLFRKAFIQFDFAGDSQRTRVELCACTRVDKNRDFLIKIKKIDFFDLNRIFLI